MAVALLAEGVGRNLLIPADTFPGLRVALLAEGVGRNCASFLCLFRTPPVALLAEGVGRNGDARVYGDARVVALLAEGVGRNDGPIKTPALASQSPSSRRAWVEIA